MNRKYGKKKKLNETIIASSVKSNTREYVLVGEKKDWVFHKKKDIKKFMKKKKMSTRQCLVTT